MSLQLEARHLIVEQQGSRMRLFGWARSQYINDGVVTTMLEPMPANFMSIDFTNSSYEFNGFMLREGGDMMAMNADVTSKATGGRLLISG